MRRSLSLLRQIAFSLFVGIGCAAIPNAQATPATYIVTPTALSAIGGCGSGNACSYKAYQGCNLTAQTVGALIGTAVVGTALPGFTGDTTTPPKVCFRGENMSGAGGFGQVFTLNAIAPIPGTTTATMTCTFAIGSPPGNFSCVAQ